MDGVFNWRRSGAVPRTAIPCICEWPEETGFVSCGDGTVIRRQPIGVIASEIDAGSGRIGGSERNIKTLSRFIGSWSQELSSVSRSDPPLPSSSLLCLCAWHI
ncbi:hypothetical protein DPEC_G00183930 [Dallia pectoralis]|uniref:Uncharacterized protein n=1 Tax=Dallia pectoralis TaxID=75939 RepID=A0ACC2GBA0_DALPE|nr:hypothetical protein DPEC_G00183930 [Dallia pectoralis]